MLAGRGLALVAKKVVVARHHKEKYDPNIHKQSLKPKPNPPQP